MLPQVVMMNNSKDRSKKKAFKEKKTRFSLFEKMTTSSKEKNLIFLFLYHSVLDLELKQKRHQLEKLKSNK